MGRQEINSFVSDLSLQDSQAIASQEYGHATVYRAVGCEHCDRGYKGRIGLYQVMPVSDAIQALILHDSDTQALAAQAAREGVRTLRQAGWLKVLQGITSIEEVMAMTRHG
jgi:type IV pilus assembly protein PilB